MSKESWQAAGLALLACGILAPIVGWYFGANDVAVPLGVVCIVGAGTALRLGSYAKSRSERNDDDASGL
jgi:hypothetical protein